MNSLKLLILVGILFLGVFLRLYKIDSVPPSVSMDEASIGYNAYSILKTGGDEYGKFSILLRAYDDWRPALYVYLVVPFVKSFGLNVLFVRLPSVILSVLTVIAVYFLVKELFKKWEIAFLTSFLLAISPWHIYISRLGHEANAGLAFMIFAILFFLKKRIYISVLFFTLSFISYQAEKIVIPVILLGMLLVFKKEMLEMKKKVIIAFLLASIILVPFIKETITPNALIRFQATSIFQGYTKRFQERATLLAEATKEGDILGKIVNNRRVVAAQIIVQGYLFHFDPNWLFFNTFSDRHKVPGLGLLYFWELPFILLGMIVLILKKFDPKIKRLVFLWLLIAPLPAAFTTDAPHAMRSYTFLPTWQIFSALGLLFIFTILKNQIYHKTMIVIASGVVILSIAYFYRQYFIVFPREQSASFQYALSKAIPFVLENEKNYDKVVFSSKDNLYQSYMFFLFYSKHDPSLYQSQGGTKSGGFAETHTFGKYEFRPVDLKREQTEDSSLYIVNSFEAPDDISILKTFKNLDGQETIKIFNK